MKKIEAIIKPFQLNRVIDALHQAGAQGLTVYEVRGLGRQRGRIEFYDYNENYQPELMPKIKIELVVADALAEKVIATIAEFAKTGRIGDGKIFVTSVEQAIRIRTGEKNEEAI